MKCKINLRTTLGLVVLAGAVGVAALATPSASSTPPTHDEIAGKPALKVRDTELKNTSIVPDYEHRLERGKNTVWCSTFQLAWNELGGVMGEPIRYGLSCGTDPAAQFIGAMNGSAASRADLDNGSYIAMAGFGRDGIIGKVRAALADTFKGAASPNLLPPQMDSDTILAYAYLFKNLAFADPFIKREHPLQFGGKGDVASFGLWDTDRIDNWAALAKQVSVLSYSAPGDWVVELKTTSPGDRLIVARLPAGPDETLRGAVEAALKRAADSKPQAMDRRDTLMVPIMNFDVTRSYHEIVGAPIEGTKARGEVGFALQNIRLRLDERGAVLKSEAAIAVVTSALVDPDKPRHMVCDGPFLFMMMRADCPRPYYAMWVNNEELLVPFAKR